MSESTKRWAQVTIGDLIVLDYGRALADSVRSGNGYPVYGSSGLVGHNSKALVNGPGIVVGRKGTVGAVSWSPEPFWPIDTTYYVRWLDEKRADRRWTYWVLATLPLKRLDSSTGVPGLNRNDAYRLRAQLPPIDEQRRIAEILDEANEAIRSTERLIAKLGQVKQGMLHDLLTCGIDESGKPRDPFRHPHMFLETPMGLFPRAWKAGLLGDVVSKGEYGISLPLAYGSGVPIIRMNNLHEGEIVLQDIKSCFLPVPSRLLLQPGDVLFNRTNSMDHVGRTGIWRDQREQFSFASYLIRLVHDPKTILPQYLNMLINYSETQLNLRKFATPGVHQVNVNPPNLRRVPIAYPPSITEQAAICERVEAVDTEIAQLRGLRRQHRLMKQGLVDDLLTGRVRVGALG